MQDVPETRISRRLGRRFWFMWVSFVSFAGWRLGRYGLRLWRQPRFVVDRSSANASETIDAVRQALAIASANVNHGIEDRHLPDGREMRVLCAGPRNFREPWARDFAFASHGLMAMGELRTAREGLKLFLAHQRASGQLPVKLHSTNILDRYLHALFGRQQPVHAPLRPKFLTAHRTTSLDGNALLVIAALHYAAESGDDEFVVRHWQQLRRAIAWLQQHHDRDTGLLAQGAFTDWADSVARTGHVLYTNVLYWKAVREMARAADRLAQEPDRDAFERLSAELTTAVQQHFWRDHLGYYVTSARFNNLSSSGNLLAIAWGLAEPDRGHAILDRMHALGMADPVPTQVTSHAYPPGSIALENRLAGIGHYHTQAAWLWLGAWHVIALARVGRHSESAELLARMSRVIVDDGVVHEVYGKDGRHLSTRWYTSEAPLTWNASMFLYAAHYLKERPRSKIRDASLD